MPDFDLTAIKDAGRVEGGPTRHARLRHISGQLLLGGCHLTTQGARNLAEDITDACDERDALIAEIERHRSCRYDIGLRDGAASELPHIERLKAEIERLRAELDRLQEAAETLVDLITEHRAVEIQYQLTDRYQFYAAYREVKGEAYPFEALDERRRHNA